MARQLQVAENEAKIKEANIKKFPKVIANALYQYNFEIGKITIPAGPDGIVYDREKEQY
ncbi:hypothetical protein [Chitinophaga sp.]|uniref:hypothetical protein n=1 Tax=Chitinophaga sp. TaxID=1869181 RepID=UPI0031D0F6B1